METRNCKRCNGTKIITNWCNTGKDRPCTTCDGLGEFPAIDEASIRAAVVASKGKNKGKLRASMTSPCGDNLEAKRAYYVWRLARFHGGVDVTMPMMAQMLCGGDAYEPELNKLADTVAVEQFGTHMAAARAWRRALYG